MAQDTVWRALAGNPLRYLVSAWPWRSFGYVLSTPLVAVPTALLVGACVSLGVALSPVVVGIVLLAHLPLLGVPVGVVERRRLRLMTSEVVPSPHPGEPAGSLRAWVSVRRDEPATFREIGYAVVLVGLGVLNGVTAFVTLGGTALFLASPLVARSGTATIGPWSVDDSWGRAAPPARRAAPVQA